MPSHTFNYLVSKTGAVLFPGCVRAHVCECVCARTSTRVYVNVRSSRHHSQCKPYSLPSPPPHSNSCAHQHIVYLTACSPEQLSISNFTFILHFPGRLYHACMMAVERPTRQRSSYCRYDLLLMQIVVMLQRNESYDCASRREFLPTLLCACSQTPTYRRLSHIPMLLC